MCASSGERTELERSCRVAVVTGSNSGIGFEVARALLRDGMHVVLACRDEMRASRALETLLAEIEGASAEVQLLDLASLASVQSFAETFRKQYQQLDLLVNNAGVMLAPYGETKDGFEHHWGINHLGHFALTGMLLDHLQGGKYARIVTVTSAAYRFGRRGCRNLIRHGGRKLTRFGYYAASKLANLLFSLELHRRLRGSKTLSLSAHPGGVATGLGKHATDRRVYQALLPVLERLSQSAAQGARSIIAAATSSNVHGGELFHPGGWLEMRGDPICSTPTLNESDLETARRLWKEAEEQTGVRFP